MRINPFYLHGEEFTPVRKLLALHALAGGVPLTEYTATGNPVSFETNVAKPLSSCLLSFLPVQSGTGDPSPENVRPITGWTGAKAWRTGKNMFDGQFPGISTEIEYRAIYVGDSVVTVSTNCIQVNGETTLLFALPGNVQSGAATGSNGIWDGQSRTITPVGGYITIGYRIAYQVNPASYDTQIEIGNTATTYEPYTGQSVSVTFPAQAGTVYGGTLDLATGILTVTWAGFSKKWSEGINATDMGSGITRKQYPMVNNLKTGSAYNLCNIAPYGSSEGAYVHFYYSGSGATNRNCRMFLPSDTDDDTEITVITNISVPLVYQLTPSEIQTLIGTNVIWSDTNTNMTVKYLKKG